MRGSARARRCCGLLGSGPTRPPSAGATARYDSRPRGDHARRRAGRQRRQSHAGRNRQDADRRVAGPLVRRAQDVRVGLVSRGYGAKPGQAERRSAGAGPKTARRAARARSRSRARRAAGHRRVRLPVDAARRRLSASPHRPRSGYRADRCLGAVRLRPRLSARHAARAAGRLAPGAT